MTGVKGRSGRANTPEAKAAKARAGRARWGEDHPGDAATGAPDRSPTPLDDPLETLADHDRQIGRPVTWPDALKRLQMVEQAIINEKREVELEEAKAKRDLARGEALTKQRHLELIRETVDCILSLIPIVTDAALAQHPSERQPVVRHALDQAVRQFREEAAVAVRGK